VRHAFYARSSGCRRQRRGSRSGRATRRFLLARLRPRLRRHQATVSAVRGHPLHRCPRRRVGDRVFGRCAGRFVDEGSRRRSARPGCCLHPPRLRLPAANPGRRRLLVVADTGLVAALPLSPSARMLQKSDRRRSCPATRLRLREDAGTDSLISVVAPGVGRFVAIRPRVGWVFLARRSSCRLG
jgi:hypothetical protein